ncbi:MAG: hypothetical protein ACRDPO_34920 [Streptosporangiaceae bacterium]
MVLPARSLPPRPSLDWLRKAAKDHLRALRAGRPAATLARAQRDVARQYTVPPITPNGGSFLAFARTTAAIDRLLELGVDRDQRDRWGTSLIEAMSRLGPRGRPLVQHLLARGMPATGR